MNSDIPMAIGLVLAVLFVPAFLSALVDRRLPIAAALTALTSGGLITWAVLASPGTYSLREIPHVFIRIAAEIL